MKKGFTLIELLAVIVILAIIALIATPIIMGIINESRKNAGIRSAEQYVHTVKIKTASENTTNEIDDTICNILDGGNLNCSGINNLIEVKVNNSETINSGGYIVIKDGMIEDLRNLNINGKYYSYDENKRIVVSDSPAYPCRVLSSNTIEQESEIMCGSERFHVISMDSSNVKLLADYNITLSTNPMQTEVFTPTYFSNNTYWLANDSIINSYETETDSNYYYVYDSNSNVYQYVEAYKSTLNKMGVHVVSAKLINMEEINSIPQHIYDMRADLNTWNDSYGYQIQEQYSTSEINNLLETSGLSNLHYFEYFTEFEKAKLVGVTLAILETEGLSNASDADKYAFLTGVVDDYNNDTNLPYWAYSGKYYWAGFISQWHNTNLCYPWKKNYTSEAPYNDNNNYSIRPVVTIPKSDIEI